MIVVLFLACADPPVSRDPSSVDTTTSTSAPVEPTTPEPDDSGTPPSAPVCPCPGAYDPLQITLVESGADMVLTYGEPDTWRDELVVFLHGTNQSPSHHTWILQAAAYAGYRTLGLQHQTDPEMSTLCLENYTEPDWPECGSQGHSAKIYGSEYADFIEVTDESSLVGRLHTRLVELHALDPEAGWDAYFLPAAPDVIDHERYLVWDRILLSGYSQGAGHAAFLAIDQQVDGVVLMSGPPDPDEYLDWVKPGATPGCAWLTFRHEAEDLTDYITENWDLLGVPTVDAPIDLPLEACWPSWPPFDGGQRFTSSLIPANEPACDNGDAPHGSMAHNPCMNVADAPVGDPYTLFRPYLYAFCRAGELDPDGAGGCSSP